MFSDKRRNEGKEFEENLLTHINSMYNLAYRLTRHRQEASDLVQEASLKAYCSYHTFEKDSNFKAWILTIVRNMFINQYRRQMKEPVKVDYQEFENFLQMPDMTSIGEEIFSESVQKSIDQLPEELQTVIVLFYVEELPYKDIANVMDCPIGTVMSRLHMARQMLKKKLNQLLTST